jgi:hypothetical protein
MYQMETIITFLMIGTESIKIQQELVAVKNTKIYTGQIMGTVHYCILAYAKPCTKQNVNMSLNILNLYTGNLWSYMTVHKNWDSVALLKFHLFHNNA